MVNRRSSRPVAPSLLLGLAAIAALLAPAALFFPAATATGADDPPKTEKTDSPKTEKAAGIERPEMITPEAEAAIKRGVAYLARTQSSNGSWSTSSGYPTAMTALAGLALLSAGNTPLEGEYSKHVGKAIEYLLRNSNSSGLIADMSQEQSCMHGHGFAMLFLAEAYGMDRNERRQREVRRVLERAIKLTGESQSAMGGWLYQPNSNSDEGSVTVTQIQGLRACRNVGIKVPKSIIDKACKYIEKSANPDGGISYRVGMSGSRPPITAAAVATMYNAGQYENPIAVKALDFVKSKLKAGGISALGGGHEYYSLFYSAQAMYLSSDENWKSFFPPARDRLIKAQTGDGAWNGDGMGEVYGTSIAVICLQLPYAYVPILQR